MTTNAEFHFPPNREVRTIPRGWQHPKTASGRYEPLIPADYVFDEAERFPVMPDASGLPEADTEIAAHESTTEGTPISPAFPNPPDGRRGLVLYCAEHACVFGHERAGVEAWAALLFGDAVVTPDGGVIAHDS